MKLKNISKVTISKNAYLVAYKLLHDALFLGLLTFAALMVAEGLLPGLITSHVGTAKVLAAIFALIAAIIWIGKKFQITYKSPRLKRNRFLPVLVIFVFLLIGNSLLKFALWENLAITTATIFAFFLFYELLFSSNPE